MDEIDFYIVEDYELYVFVERPDICIMYDIIEYVKERYEFKRYTIVLSPNSNLILNIILDSGGYNVI